MKNIKTNKKYNMNIYNKQKLFIIYITLIGILVFVCQMFLLDFVCFREIGNNRQVVEGRFGNNQFVANCFQIVPCPGLSEHPIARMETILRQGCFPSFFPTISDGSKHRFIVSNGRLRRNHEKYHKLTFLSLGSPPWQCWGGSKVDANKPIPRPPSSPIESQKV